MSTEQLRAELNRRGRQVTSLERKRDRLYAQLEDVEAQLAEFGPIAGGGAGRKRARNSMTLEEALHGVLDGTIMGVSEAADAVQAAGYNTTAANFRTIVNQTLIRSKQFKKVARGQYTAK
ncbi:MAG: hypothetical protein AAGG07_07215 [Planctomycetota bacterium]